MGDLNYRVDGTATIVQKLIDAHRFEAIDSLILLIKQVLLNNDQLLKERRLQRCFAGFQESQIHFMPTYKFENDSSKFELRGNSSSGDLQEQVNATYDALRVPSWSTF